MWTRVRDNLRWFYISSPQADQDGWVPSYRVLGKALTIKGKSITLPLRIWFSCLWPLVHPFMRFIHLTRKLLGEIVFNHFIYPPDTLCHTLVPCGKDYGHGYLYEDLFCRDSIDLEAIESLARSYGGPILDLAGGMGRLSYRLSQAGFSTTLVDISQDMLDAARTKQGNFSIVQQDISSLNLPQKFALIVSLKNGLEHLPDQAALIRTLTRIKSHLAPGGIAVLDLHNPQFCEKLPRWTENAWYYSLDIRARGKRTRLWSRSLRETSTRIRADHAISQDLKHFTLLSSSFQLLTEQQWEGLFRESGFTVLHKWGDWLKNPPSNNLPHLIYLLS